MSFCTFADGAAMFDATPIENLFLTEYMYEAPAAAPRLTTASGWAAFSSVRSADWSTTGQL